MIWLGIGIGFVIGFAVACGVLWFLSKVSGAEG